MNGVTDGTVPLFHVGARYGFSEGEVPDLKGKRVLVTGASGGIGLATAQLLARKRATVVGTARSEAKCAATLEKLGGGECVVLELASLAKVKAAADRLKKKPFDYVILNAGLMAPPELSLSEDGLEEQFAVNYLAQFLLARELAPTLKKGARLVVVSSVAHYSSPPPETMLRAFTAKDHRGYAPFPYYGWSKLCNVLMALDFPNHFPGVLAASVHPGAVQSGLLQKYERKVPAALLDLVERSLLWTADTAALSVVAPLFLPDASLYYVPVARPRPPSAYATNASLAADLWAFSDTLLDRTLRQIQKDDDAAASINDLLYNSKGGGKALG
eukprot:CAMPEP_0198671462 /NCGR_PEP_ID=MMETSP1467-20131203/86258_1 /TAXON_ID=1462469 /ORGANISM="unid. sp., Strain CCMP2135" /LENGTH=328 /DNA_ID=CAMNT_0044408263 /DNA_START=1 /DNA_END=987 /DNA_ORIENTATION=-